MKLDILVPIGEKGGVENVINMIVPYLLQQGLELRVVQLISSGVVWTEEGIPFYTLLEGLENHTLAEFADSYVAFLKRNGNPDCILATAWPSMCYVAKKTAFLMEKDINVISWLHAPVSRYEDAGYGSYEYLEYADSHLAISQTIWKDLKEHFPQSIAQYVYNPVELKDSKVSINTPNVLGAKRLYYVGRVSEEKRIDVMLQAIVAEGDRWELFIIGDDGNRYAAQMKQHAKLLGASERIHWMGWQEEPWDKVVHADAVVIASEYEGFCLAAVEAQARGVPVLSTPVGVIPELITPGVNGYIYPFGDWKKLSDILYELSCNKKMKFDSAVCRQRAMQFEKENAVKDFYNKLLEIWEKMRKEKNKLAKREEATTMTRKQIYQTNVYVQSIIHRIISACRVQNYDKAIRSFVDMNGNLMQILEAVFSDLSFYNQETEIVNPEGVGMALNDMLTAQECGDYVLFADLLELQLVPFLQSIQEAIRTYDVECAEPDVWTRNMDMLGKTNRILWNKLLTYHECYEKENAEGSWQGSHHLEDTNSGAFTMVGQDEKGMYYYHSNADPNKEAVEFAKYYYNPGTENYVVWGLGLGYQVRELMRLDSGISLSVYESDLDVIYHCMMAVDMTVCMAQTGFSICYDPDFKEIIEALDHLKENFILHYPSLRHIADGRIREQMEMFFISDSGKRNAEILFESNSRENFKYYDGYVDELQASFEGKKAIIVAAGPSLDKNVELLKNKNEDMLILATGTVFRKLINLGINVDFVIVTDANSRIYHQIAGYENQSVPLLYLSTAYKGFSMNYQGKKYLICQNGYNKAEELAARNGWGLYATGGSVSTTALEICIRLGCREIAFIGLDLAYTDNLAHAEGTSRRVAEEAGEQKQVPAIGGGTVPISRVFMIYNKWIENRVKKADVTMPVIDATEGGAIVPGLKLMTLKEYMK